MTGKRAAWEALGDIWQEGNEADWQQTRLALAEARGTVLLSEALEPVCLQRVFVFASAHVGAVHVIE